MDFLGIGPVELLVILVVAVIFLGPEKMVDVGRTLGRAVRELRKATSELPKALLEAKDEAERIAGPDASVAYQQNKPEAQEKGEKKPPEGGQAS